MPDVLKPQDVVVALKLLSQPQPWQIRPLAAAVRMSSAEVCHSLQRLKASRLYNGLEHRVIRPALLEFILHGLQYVFPAQLGLPEVGLPTAFSVASLARHMVGGDVVAIWKSSRGSVHGRAVEPLWHRAPEAAADDPVLYEYLALVDALRVGRVRDRDLARDELRRRFAS